MNFKIFTGESQWGYKRPRIGLELMTRVEEGAERKVSSIPLNSKTSDSSTIP